MFISKEKYKACIYTRLSKDDGDKPESDSIGNQKALIRDFIKNHSEIQVVSERLMTGIVVSISNGLHLNGSWSRSKKARSAV